MTPRVTWIYRLFCVLLLAAGSGWAQYTDMQVISDLGGPQEFARRRQELLKQVRKGYVVLFARTHLPEAAHYREDNDFFYFTGVADPGAVLLMDAEGGDGTLFEPLQADRTRQVLGPNLQSLPGAEREKLGFKKVLPASELDSVLSGLLLKGETELWVRMYPDKADGARGEIAREDALPLHAYASGVEQVAMVRKLRERYPTAQFHDVTTLIDSMRNIKTPAEIALLRRNGKLSAAGIRRGIARSRPGMYEYQVEAEASYVFRNGGAPGWAYPAIVSSGPNVNTVHYFNDRRKIEANELVVFDFGADLGHEAMDITRTYNVSGRFTPEQAKWYAVDLEAEKAVIAMLKPGNTYEQAAAAGKAVYEKAGVGDKWRGFPGHFVGLAVHDVLVPRGPIRAGQVVTVEPMIEFPDKRIHMRVEDTVLITENGPEVLTGDVPKEMAEVEKLVGSEAEGGPNFK